MVLLHMVVFLDKGTSGTASSFFSLFSYFNFLFKICLHLSGVVSNNQSKQSCCHCYVTDLVTQIHNIKLLIIMSLAWKIYQMK